MEILDRLSRFIQAQIDYGSNNPEEVIDKWIEEIELTIVQLRKTIAQTTADKKRLEEKYNYHLSETNRWQQKAELALVTGDENSAKKALIYKQFFQGNIAELEAKIESNKSIETITYLPKKLSFLEMKLADYKLLQAKYNFSNCLKAYRELQATMDAVNINSTRDVFELIEDKILQIEAESQFAAELNSISLEKQLSQLDRSSDTDDELAVMKTQLLSSSGNLASSTDTPKDSTIEAELEKLKAQLNNS
jgi:phage shock protein A